jgi:hypothetical protein
MESGVCGRTGSGCRHTKAGVGWERSIRCADRRRIAIACGISSGCALCARVLRGFAVFSGSSSGCALCARVLTPALPAAALHASATEGLTPALPAAALHASAAEGLTPALPAAAPSLRGTEGLTPALPAARFTAALRAAKGFAAAACAAETPGMDDLRPDERQGRSNYQTDRCFVHERHLLGSHRTFSVEGSNVTCRAALERS